MAVLIPVLSGLSQYLSVKLSQQTTAVTNNPQADQMASTMKTMNVTLPLVSVFMCFTLPTGLGIYWVASAVVRMVQQFFINKHLNKIPMDELIKENMEKAAEKRKNKNEVDASNVNKMAHKNVKNIHEPVRTAAQTKELEEKLRSLLEKNSSIDAVVARYDELAAVALSVARKMGKKVPDDLSVLGFDNDFISNYVSPTLTTVEIQKEEVGRAAMEALLALIRNEKLDKEISFAARLIIRESTEKNKNK